MNRRRCIEELARRLALGPDATADERAEVGELLRAAECADPAVLRGLARAPVWPVVSSQQIDKSNAEHRLIKRSRSRLRGRS